MLNAFRSTWPHVAACDFRLGTASALEKFELNLRRYWRLEGGPYSVLPHSSMRTRRAELYRNTCHRKAIEEAIRH